jgi:hypothetical protein
MFDGSTSKLEDWIRQMETYFILQSQVFVTEEAKILTAFQFCRGGTAGDWAKHHVEQYIKARSNQPCIWNDVVRTWEALKAKMQLRFGDQYEKETARTKIARARQGDKKIRQYIEEFVQHLPKADLPNDQQCQYLMGGVNDEIWEMIKQIPLQNLSFIRLCQLLETAEKNYVAREIAAEQRRRQQRGVFQQSSQPTTSTQKSYFANTRREVIQQQSRPAQTRETPSYKPTTQPRPSYQMERQLPQGEPMDIDRIKKNQQAGSKVKCYKCRQFGHIWKNCPVKTIRELKEDQINEILEAHFQASPEPNVFDVARPYTQKVIEDDLETVPEVTEEGDTLDFQ